MAELALYEVQHRNFTTTVKMSAEEAESYGDRAKRVGAVKPAERQPVTQPPYATTDSEVGEGQATPSRSESKQAPARRNKARAAADDK